MEVCMKRMQALVMWGITAVCATGCSSTTTTEEKGANTKDITNAIFTETSFDCADYSGEFSSIVRDEQKNLVFDGYVTVESGTSDCTMTVNGIPNHDFNDESAHFATAVSENERVFSVNKNPAPANSATALSQMYYDAIMLNGVVVDMLSAGCYKPNDPQADADGNVQIGCSADSNWLLDPLGTETKFGADAHNAHTQPDGTYHYHGNPMAMFDEESGAYGSPVIGFAADGFPIYGSYFLDPESNQVRKAISGYELKSGSRPETDNTNPGGNYDGQYIQDYEFTGNGDLDECNGMTVNGNYGYYVTDSYPWLIACHSGTVNESFSKGQGKMKQNVTFWMHEH